MRKLFIILGIIVLLLGFFIGGPFFTLYKFKTGIDSNNADKVNSCLDFEKLRPNIKSQLEKAFSTGKDTNTSTNPMAVFFNKFVSGLADKLLNTYVSPEGISSLLEKKSKYQKDSESETGKDKTEKDESGYDIRNILENYKISGIGSSEFVLTLNTNDSERKIDVVMNRYGFSWKVTNIIFPEKFFENFRK